MKPELVAFTDVQGFLEALGDDAELSCVSIEGVLDNLTELVMNSWSTLLDSGATSHLVNLGREYFWSYNEEVARNVKTANLGILQTQGSGTCVVHFMYNRASTKVTLRNCLHTPHAFMNLLSVRHFVTANFSCTFEKDHVLLSKVGRPFGYGPMVNKLFLLEVEFLKPPGVLSPPVAASPVVEHPSSAYGQCPVVIPEAPALPPNSFKLGPNLEHLKTSQPLPSPLGSTQDEPVTPPVEDKSMAAR